MWIDNCGKQDYPNEKRRAGKPVHDLQLEDCKVYKLVIETGEFSLVQQHKASGTMLKKQKIFAKKISDFIQQFFIFIQNFFFIIF